MSKEKLDDAIEALVLLCEPVVPPRGDLEHIHYFCGNTEIASDLKEHEPQRVALYKAVVVLVRAYANIADELEKAGYSTDSSARIRQQVETWLKLREIIRRASGETLDLKAYEADMRHLIDTYIEASEPRKISLFDNMGLLELIVKTGIANAINTQLGDMKGNKDAIAETIENNVRSKILKEHLNDPAFYERMSALLSEIIAARKSNAIAYEDYLKQVAALAQRVQAGQAEDTPDELDTPGKRALYNNLKVSNAAEAPATYNDKAEDKVLDQALRIDAIVRNTRPDDWRGVQTREQVIKRALYEVLQDQAEVERLFLIIRAQTEY